MPTDKEPMLVVMLTKNDLTVPDAAKIFELCKDSQAQCWGIKEHPLPPNEMQRLFARMKECGKTTFLEVVAYTEEEGLAGARLAADCGCDILMGTSFSDRILAFCQSHSLKYMPFVGTVTGRPSLLQGSVEDMIRDARAYLRKGAFGIDLLGYRYLGDATALIQTFVKQVDAPVCLAGSINSYQRLDEVRQVAPWAFTIGSAFFDGCFGSGLKEQVNNVCNYIRYGETR